MQSIPLESNLPPPPPPPNLLQPARFEPPVPFQFNAVRSYFNPYLQVRGQQIGFDDSTSHSVHPSSDAVSVSSVQTSAGSVPPTLGTPKGRNISQARSRKQKNTPTNLAANKSSDKNVTPTKVTVVNGCLAFIKSQLFRHDQGSVLDLTVPSFNLDELKAAREVLYRNSGTKVYIYKGPNDPSTADEKSRHCAASIIYKMQELDTLSSHTTYDYVCSASDLFRVAGLMFLHNNDRNTEKRLQFIESKIKSMETNASLNTTASVQWPLPSVNNPGSGFAPSKRIDLINKMSKTSSASSPNKRKRSDGYNSDTVQVNMRPKIPQNHNVLKGKPSRGLGSKPTDICEVFLYNYCEDADPESVLNHFRSQGVNAVSARFRCHPNNPDKKFVMRIKAKEDFAKVVFALPDFTGCRWYDPVHRPDPDNRPKGFFNNGRKILGPVGSLQSSHDTTQVNQNADPGEPMHLVERPDPPPYSRQAPVLAEHQHSSDPTTDHTNVPTGPGGSSSPPHAVPLTQAQCIPPSVPMSESSPICTSSNGTATTTTVPAASLVNTAAHSVSSFIKPLVNTEHVKPTFQVGSAVSLNYVSAENPLFD